MQFASYEENKLEYESLKHHVQFLKRLRKPSDKVTFISVTNNEFE